MAHAILIKALYQTILSVLIASYMMRLSKKIYLTEGNKTISNNNKLCRVFNNFFSETVNDLKIPNISNYKLDNTTDPPKH